MDHACPQLLFGTTLLFIVIGGTPIIFCCIIIEKIICM